MSMLLAFAPFLAFAVLQNLVGTHNALLAATAISALLIVRETVFQKRSLKWLEAGSLVLFGGLAVLAKQPAIHLSIVEVRLIVDAGLFVIAAVSLLVGRPFTLQYAREQVSSEVAARPGFIAVNMAMTAVWALAFAAIVAADAAMLYLPGFTSLAGTAAIVASMGVAALVSAWLPKAILSKARPAH